MTVQQIELSTLFATPYRQLPLEQQPPELQEALALEAKAAELLAQYGALCEEHRKLPRQERAELREVHDTFFRNEVKPAIDQAGLAMCDVHWNMQVKPLLEQGYRFFRLSGDRWWPTNVTGVACVWGSLGGANIQMLMIREQPVTPLKKHWLFLPPGQEPPKMSR